MKKIAFYIKQYIKMALQSVILPVVYRYYRQRPLNKRLVRKYAVYVQGGPCTWL